MKVSFVQAVVMLAFFGVRLGLWGGVFSWTTFAVADVKDARLWHAPDHSRLVFDLSKPAEHKIFTLSRPNRVVVDLDQAKLLHSLKHLPLSQGPIIQVRYGPRATGGLRVVLDLRESVTPKSFLLKPNASYGHRLVLDLFRQNSTQLTPGTPAAPIVGHNKRDIVIAIDAGHGGEDPGALGRNGLYEKDVVLRIAQALERCLQQERGYKPVMIRSGDYYVPLRQRNHKARQVNADLMVSIHADAFTNARAQGSSVYAISPKGATSEAARWLADAENRADLIGGVGGLSLEDKDDVLAEVLLDLSQTATMSASLAAGDQVLQQLAKIGRLHKKRIEQAQFVVLKSPDVPSILVEAGFITSPKEAERLNSRLHRRALAKAISTGIFKYFSQMPPPGSYVAWVKQKAFQFENYVIHQGDTLSTIAQRHNLSLQEIKQFNALSSDRIHIGQVLKVPTS